MLDFAYWREHLIIVTELLHESLSECYRSFATDDARIRFFSQSTMAALSSQMLDALAFLHELGVTHCDVKTENICLSPTRHCHFTLIDLGSAVLTYDVHNSYVQSRWYRAPEVILGVPWGPKVDVWSLGCVEAEVIFGQPLFRRASSSGVLASQIAVLGPIPEYMLQYSPELVRMFFTDTGFVFEVNPPEKEEGASILQPLPLRQLENMLNQAIEPALFGADVNGFVEHVHMMLTIDPQLRPTAASAAQHQWLLDQRQPSS